MLLERMLYGLCAAALLLFIGLDTLQSDGIEGKLAMGGFSLEFGLLAFFLPIFRAVWAMKFGFLLLIPQVFTAWFLSFAAGIFLYGLFGRKTGDARFLLVPGTLLNGAEPSAMLEGRLEAAADFARAHPGITMILSGGQVRQEKISEAEAMGRWMRQRGISGFHTENRSETTYQNFRNALVLLRELGFREDMELAVATDLYHFLRCVWLARKLGYRKLRLVPSRSGSLHCAGCFFREVMVFVKLTFVGPF